MHYYTSYRNFHITFSCSGTFHGHLFWQFRSFQKIWPSIFMLSDWLQKHKVLWQIRFCWRSFEETAIGQQPQAVPPCYRNHIRNWRLLRLGVSPASTSFCGMLKRGRFAWDRKSFKASKWFGWQMHPKMIRLRYQESTPKLGSQRDLLIWPKPLACAIQGWVSTSMFGSWSFVKTEIVQGWNKHFPKALSKLKHWVVSNILSGK